MTIQELKAEFDRQPLEVQNETLWEYINYVTEYPEEHDSDSYPASFFEWYTNDWQEEIDSRNGKI